MWWRWDSTKISSEPLHYCYGDGQADELRQYSSWTVIFANYILICSESRLQVESTEVELCSGEERYEGESKQDRICV